MKWEMEITQVEAVLEKIWDLHDKLSDAIHSISRTHFLNSLNNPSRRKTSDEDDNCKGFVYVKDWDKDPAISEARSLNAIRTALENLEDQLEFLHTVQIQRRAERDVAYAQLEQSRIILALRLTEHHGKKYKVIEEALDFIRDVQGASCFVSPADMSPAEHLKQQSQQAASSNVLTRLASLSIGFAKRSLRFDAMGGAFGNAALFTISMIAVHHLHRLVCNNGCTVEVNQKLVRTSKRAFQHEDPSSECSDWSGFDVLSARG